MSDTPVNDGFSYRRACGALKNADEALAALKKAELLFAMCEEDTNAEIPDIEDAIAVARALILDICEGIDAYEEEAAA